MLFQGVQNFLRRAVFITGIKGQINHLGCRISQIHRVVLLQLCRPGISHRGRSFGAEAQPPCTGGDTPSTEYRHRHGNCRQHRCPNDYQIPFPHPVPPFHRSGVMYAEVFGVMSGEVSCLLFEMEHAVQNTSGRQHPKKTVIFDIFFVQRRKYCTKPGVIFVKMFHKQRFFRKKKPEIYVGILNGYITISYNF